MSIPLRRVALLLSSVVVLTLFACASETKKTKTTHTITIHYDATAKPQWSYTIVPAENDAKKARVKRKDIVQWKCDDGTWTVYFKGPTPLVNRSGQELPFVTGAMGATAGGEVAEKAKKGEEYTYGVSLLLPGATDPVVDDPRIFIEH